MGVVSTNRPEHDEDLPPVVLKIAFDNEAALQHFKSWLCGSGEQAYWRWMEFREEEENGPITATGFNYHTGQGATSIEKFQSHEIKARCGRMDGKRWER